jgi:transcriptional regulator with XRE-family HTH domain
MQLAELVDQGRAEIRAELARRQWRYEDLAARLHVSKSTIGRWMCPGGDCLVANVDDLARALGMTWRYDGSHLRLQPVSTAPGGVTDPT